MDDVTKALERLEQKWREEARDAEMCALEADSIGLHESAKSSDHHAKWLSHCADELATLRQSLAGQGEASTPRAAEAIDEAMVERALHAWMPWRCGEFYGQEYEHMRAALAASLTPPSAKGGGDGQET